MVKIGNEQAASLTHPSNPFPPDPPPRPQFDLTGLNSVSGAAGAPPSEMSVVLRSLYAGACYGWEHV